ncbi:MAG: polysulfide reductase NrfD [Flavobacteriales bacterium]|nr:polysulfide reductase NrfD [Flavobacteriales bacterium]
MKYGFVIDNRKCIGCHACTVACKSEHDVAIGVNRTWVKQVEKGTYPNTRRVFSVMRCNHCTDAPCVEICPTQALFIREDGIVDFDNDRCIGCKSCMQACPYDALYIDPDTHTAAKCNYCAHRLDIGLEPACVNVCPEHAIISGDMENPETEIAQLLAREQVTVRKPEKGTGPNVYYINGDHDSLNPGAAGKPDQYFWNSQERGVGHFARYTEKLASEVDLAQMARKLNGGKEVPTEPVKSIDVLMQKNKLVYDAPNKGVLWGWEVSGYVLTKAISAGTFVLLLILALLGAPLESTVKLSGAIVSLIFLIATLILLVKDLDQPGRFAYVLLRPHWSSWLVRGGYILSAFGLFLTLYIIALYFDMPHSAYLWIGGFFGLLAAVYTAFLFGQAKGRDFWQSPTMSIHMIVHSIMAGAAVLMLIAYLLGLNETWVGMVKYILLTGIIVNLLTMLFEFNTPHSTKDATQTAHSITHGQYRTMFWSGVIILGNLLPVAMLFLDTSIFMATGALMVLLGLWYTEKIWVEAPQKIALS